jgi:hypothetical protein
MAYVSREYDTSAAAMFALLAAPETYPRWLIGAQDVQQVDPTWPAPGSRFSHRVGVGPLTLSDSTEVLEVDAGSMLKLHVRARPLIAAVVTLHVVGNGQRCVVTMQEEPARRAIGNLVRPLMDPVIHVRNHRSLRRLAALAASS